MAKYRTLAMTFLPGPFLAGAEVEYRGWPRDQLHLQPIDDEAKAITAYYRAHKTTSLLPDTPFKNNELHLPLIGPPCWRLGKKYRDIEDAAEPDHRVLLKAIGHWVMGNSRPTHAGAFRANTWPTPDVEPANPQAKAIVDWMASHPDEPRANPPWDEERGCMNVATSQQAA